MPNDSGFQRFHCGMVKVANKIIITLLGGVFPFVPRVLSFHMYLVVEFIPLSVGCFL